MIELKSVAKRFGEVDVLTDINIGVAQGERVSLIGPGGCGKTTILKIILGLIEPDAGSVKLLNEPMNELSSNSKQALMREIGMAFQQGGLFDFMTVAENLMFAMEHMTDKTAAEMSERVHELLTTVKLPQTASMYPHELSGGMRRRVGIARALATDPTVAIFDEPTSGLDPVTSTIILKMILDLAAARSERTLLVATSNVEIAVRFAERVILVHEGRVVADGLWRELLLEGSEWVKHFLGVRFIGLDISYAEELNLPAAFIDQHWGGAHSGDAR